MDAHGTTVAWWNVRPSTPRGAAGLTDSWAAGKIPDYPAAFWCFMFFTFIVLVAPQNAYPALQPLNLAFVSGGTALLLFLVQAGARGKLADLLSGESKLVGIFAVLALLSIPFSWWRGGSWELFSGQLSKSIIVYVLAAQLLVSPRRFRQHLWLAVLSSATIAVIALVSFGAGTTSEGYRLAGGIAGLTGNPNDLALTLNLFLPFGLMLCGSASLLGRLVAAAFVVTSMVAVVLSFSRAGFITLVSILALYGLRTVQRRGLPALLTLSFLGLLGSLLVPEGYGDRVASIVETDKDQFESASTRLDNMIRAVRVTIEHPILGVGLGQNILALNEKGGRWSVVHNVYLQISADLGIAALIVYLLLIGRLIRQMRAAQTDQSGPPRPAGRELKGLIRAAEVSLCAYAIAAMFYPVAYHFYFFYVGGFAAALHTAHRRLVVPGSRV